jgi:Carboxypeptidase regulatory-like domain
MFRRLSIDLLFGLATLAASVPLCAGVLAGRVVDPDGRAVERLEAQIEVTDSAGRVFTGKVAQDGRYEVAALPAGTYSMDLNLPTRIFERYGRAGVVVAADATTQLELRLEWGMNLGTVGDDPLLQGSDLRARTRNIEGPVPRTPEGLPDLSGIWTNIGDSYAGAAPMQPWAQQVFDEWRKIKQDTPGAYCLPQSGVLQVCPDAEGRCAAHRGHGDQPPSDSPGRPRTS